MKLCVFPNDPILAYFQKGEIKERYFNPHNFFDEVHIISFSNNEIEEEKVKKIAGNAKLKIHCVGEINLKNMRKEKERVIEFVKKIEPDIIRAYNPLVQGWIAVQCSKNLKIPLLVSLHGNYDKFRDMIMKQNFKQYLKMLYTAKFIEPFVIKNADVVICVYKSILPYAKKNGAKKIELVYNRINLEQFRKKEKTYENKIPTIITVGRLIKQKNQDIILKAITQLNVKLLIIGDGKDYDRLLKLVKDLKLVNRVTFQRSVQHSEIHKWYQQADIFALAMRTDLESLPIPIIEAMAAGLPVVMSKPKIGISDGLEGFAVLSDPNPEAFTKAIKEIIENKNYGLELSKKSKECSLRFDSENIERKEMEIYEELINFKNNTKNV